MNNFTELAVCQSELEYIANRLERMQQPACGA